MPISSRIFSSHLFYFLSTLIIFLLVYLFLLPFGVSLSTLSAWCCDRSSPSLDSSVHQLFISIHSTTFSLNFIATFSCLVNLKSICSLFYSPFSKTPKNYHSTKVVSHLLPLLSHKVNFKNHQCSDLPSNFNLSNWLGSLDQKELD